MKSMLKQYFCIAALFGVAGTACGEVVAPYYRIRSQTYDAARQLVGKTQFIHQFDVEKLYGTFDITVEGTRSFRPRDIAHCLFGPVCSSNCSSSTANFCGSSCGSSCGPCFSTGTSVTPVTTFNSASCNPCGSSSCSSSSCSSDCSSNCSNDDRSKFCVFNVKGSAVPGRGNFDLFADYFGLAPDFSSTVAVKPRISNVIVDFDLYLGLDEWLCGLYFEAHAPFVHTSWKLDLCESVSTRGSLGYPAGYFAPVAIPNGSLLPSFSSFVSDGATPTLGNGIVFEPLQSARLSRHILTKNRLSDIEWALGWNFLMDEDYHFGLNIRGSIPTGNRPHGCFLFEPMVGNGHHWALGGGLNAHYTLWRCDEYDSSFSFWLDARIYHLFRTRQTRTFDLIGRPLSRYALAQRVGTPVGPNLASGAVASPVAATVQFQNAFIPLANLSTLDVKVSVPVIGEVTAFFNYTHCNWSVDFGYNFYGSSCEKINLDCDCPGRLASGRVYALKGDAFVFGFGATNATNPALSGAPIALVATESAATAFAGTNGTTFGGNASVDNAALGVIGVGPGLVATDIIVTAPGLPGITVLQTNISTTPVFLSNDLLDFNGARTRAIAHKVFAHVSYSWRDCEDWIPYIGIGGKVEFGRRHNNDDNNCSTNDCNSCVVNSGVVASATTACNVNTGCGLSSSSCSSSSSCNSHCHECTLSEWGVWIKGGIAFN